MKIQSINKQGRAHELDHKPCEDAIYVSDTPLVALIADGVSNASYGGMGAKSLVKNIGHFLSSEGTIKRFDAMTSDEVRQNFYEMFVEIINHEVKKKEGTSPADFASTFIAVFGTGDLLTIVHAGDGAVFGETHTKVMTPPIVLSYPDDNEYDQVYQAAHKDTAERMRVLRIHRSDFHSIMLGSDGFVGAYLDPSYQGFDNRSLEEVFKVTSQKEMDRLVNEVHLLDRGVTDDISCILINFDEMPVEAAVHPVDNRKTRKVSSEAIQHVEPKKKSKFKVGHIAIIVLSLLLACSLAFNVLSVSKVASLNKKISYQNTRIEEVEGELSEMSSTLEELKKLINGSDTKTDEKTEEKTEDTKKTGTNKKKTT